MILDVKFEETNELLDVQFGELQEVSDGGYERGYNEGYEVGKDDGYDDGYDEGLDKGYDSGYTIGSKDGYDKGYDDGVEQGFEDGKNSVVDVVEYLKSGTFLSLNIFGKPKVELNFKSWANNSMMNLFQITAEENKNTTVEDLTITCSHLLTSVQQILYCQYPYTDETLKRLTFNVDTQNCTNFLNAFTQLRALEVVDGEPLNFSSVTVANNTQAFPNNPSLREVRFVANSIKVSIKFANSPNLSTDTIQSIIDGLADLTGQTSQTLDFHSNILDKLTDEQLFIIMMKNWSVT